MYKVLARKYRPTKLDEVIGQPVATTILRNAIQSNKLHHAILLSGPMGVGKTSLARIIAKSINCEKGPTTDPCNQCEACIAIQKGRDIDVIEIDGASSRKIENAREIIESIKYPPLKRRFKVYIIDEIHMFTQEAFNAMLKTIEEPPEYVKFIFATTAIEKIPETILSRCQILTLTRIPEKEIEKKLTQIAQNEKIDIESEAIKLIAKASMGSLRVAEGLLDRCIAFKLEGNITADDASLVAGISTTQKIEEFIEFVINKNRSAIDLIYTLYENSVNLEQFCSQIIENLIKQEISLEKKVALLNIFYKALGDIKRKVDPLDALIVATYKSFAAAELESIEKVIEKLLGFETSAVLNNKPSSEPINSSFKETSKHSNIPQKNNQSTVDEVLTIFKGKIVNIEKIKN
ncbi:DNA polymerase III subunit gamma/tau [Hippea jasoniae]|uniref:DNA polymerase III subunit gamma/tau n=1 Tax=Hippea jasoniae TaxID=944479 RepID=UPI00068BF64F|nr:DNA polymerase III subunit gamma/tau [Hippea jasoniae]